MATDKQTQIRPVIQAIANVMANVGAVDKRGKNQFHGYEYATAGDIMHALQKRMATEGLVITANQRKVEFMANDSVMLVEFGFDLMHTSGDKLDEPLLFSGMAGCKNKNGSFDDKAVNKCLVGAMKYFMLHLFKIPTGDYHDADADGEPVAPQSRQEPRQTTKAGSQAPSPPQPPTNARPAASQAERTPFDDEAGDPILIPGADGLPEVTYVASDGTRHNLPAAKALKKVETAWASTLPDVEFDDYLKPNMGWLKRHFPEDLATFEGAPRKQVA